MSKGSTAMLQRLAKNIFGNVEDVPKIVHEGRKALYKGEGTHSMALWPFMTALKKLKGKDFIDGKVYDLYLKKLKNADERLGRVLAQHGPSQKLFRPRESVPTTKKIKGLPAEVTHETYAASAPAKKVMGVAVPITSGLYLSEKLEKKPMANEKQRSLMKQAADRIDRHRRREEAVKLAFEMVERGKCEPFSSFDEFQNKIASLEEKNLEAVREALSMDSDLTDFGKVASDGIVGAPGTDRAEMNFFHRLSE